MATVKEIKIKLNPQDEFIFEPASAKVQRGQPVKWTSEVGAFVIQMKGSSPFAEVTIKSSTDAPYLTAEKLVRTDADPGHYHYAVAVRKGNGLEIESACPDLEVS